MAFMASRVSFDLSGLLTAAAALDAGANVIVRQTANDILARAAAEAPVDTSSLRESGYVSMSTDSGYDAAVSAASGVNPKAKMLPEVTRPVTPLQAVVAFAAEHAVFNEYGTVKMAARPFLTPSAEAAREDFVKNMAELAA